MSESGHGETSNSGQGETSQSGHGETSGNDRPAPHPPGRSRRATSRKAASRQDTSHPVTPGACRTRNVQPKNCTGNFTAHAVTTPSEASTRAARPVRRTQASLPTAKAVASWSSGSVIRRRSNKPKLRHPRAAETAGAAAASRPTALPVRVRVIRAARGAIDTFAAGLKQWAQVMSQA
jgi:hypothetical protein